MNIYTIYSESHSVLFTDYFLATIPADMEVHREKMPQLCPSGSFYRDGWDKACYEKVLFFRDVCKKEMGNTFVMSDVDVQFFGSFEDALMDELGEFDIACQNDIHAYCSGFFVCRASEKTLAMFEAMVKHYRLEDQTTLNDQINSIKHKVLSNRFWNVAHVLNGVWGGRDFDIPKDILVHHANWTTGVQQKMALLDLVRSKYDERSES